MNKLTGFTDSPKQSTTIPLDDGSSAVLNLTFRAQQKGWFYDLTHGDFSLLGQRLVTGENILRQFRDQIPFGLAVLTETGIDPWQITDLASDDVAIILLSPEDVETIEQSKFVWHD